ncbi:MULTISPECIES: hypothetical protein [unclassified Acinetobacter]|uniref:hypothetical protein n=1 Tax=unclassified Acinetobacter TaxID=196816 RepID=UPI002446AC00|nr:MULTISPECIES: hypothetical protein [unclassified Acinetobacter]MDH0032038.1 hypothetical protein [Acinetobacter sp. GD04021]MDH0887694.1 hypothetical protein [Acinetobacter sp. GD03873]MDH1084042.1 hypothetical protein [Acinetobacter sp. GD03983]MDH2191031.1 hypothetical protein [Acinetobacter sp. GD03645]MDH2204554.1 hypothetical protein [Acinetobacter sp. GD03647]
MTNIPNQATASNNDFVTGDYVVLTSPGTEDVLLEIIDHKYTPDMYRVKILATGLCGPIFKDEIRHATAAEIEAGHRIDQFSNLGNSGKTDSLGDDTHVEKKQQVELLQTEVARLNHKCEMQATEMLAMQAEIDLLRDAKATEQAIEREINSTVCLVEGMHL